MSGNYKGDDSGQHATTGSVYVNNTPVDSVTVTTYQSLYPISFSGVSLNAGDTVDFIVTSASDCCFLGTGLGAAITSRTNGPTVPEPATLLLIPAGLMLVARRFRRA